jgi:hypothetical protein
MRKHIDEQHEIEEIHTQYAGQAPAPRIDAAHKLATKLQADVDANCPPEHIQIVDGIEINIDLLPYRIVVLDRGFVYVGRCYLDDRYLTLFGAWNIRYWGTTRGLGQLALEGPRPNTQLDRVGTVLVPLHALNHAVRTEVSLWSGLASK